MPNEVQPEREKRDALYREWNQCVDELVPGGKWAPAWRRLRLLRPLRKEGEIFVIAFNAMHVDYLKHRTPELYKKLSEKCRMVKSKEGVQ